MGGLLIPTYFITMNSFAAPFVSDKSEKFVEAATAMGALKKACEEYHHPRGLFAAQAESPTEERKILARYLSSEANHDEGEVWEDIEGGEA